MIIDNKITDDFPMALIGYVIIVIAVLIYNEIVIVYLWGFNKYTKKCIIERNITKKEITYFEFEQFRIDESNQEKQ